MELTQNTVQARTLQKYAVSPNEVYLYLGLNIRLCFAD